MKAVGEFTNKLWECTSEIYEELISCSFVTGLSNGTLSESAFKHYLSQDVIYIQKDAEALAKMSYRALFEKERDFFKRMVSDCIEIEDVLHNEFMDYFQVEVAKEQSSAFSDYNSFLEEKVNNAAYPIAIAALLPCFWLYGKVGHHILATQSPNNKYQKFIDTYSGEEYIDYTKEFISIMENQASKVNKVIQEEIIHAFIESSRHELNVFLEAGRL